MIWSLLELFKHCDQVHCSYKLSCLHKDSQFLWDKVRLFWNLSNHIFPLITLVVPKRPLGAVDHRKMELICSNPRSQLLASIYAMRGVPRSEMTSVFWSRDRRFQPAVNTLLAPGVEQFSLQEVFGQFTRAWHNGYQSVSLRIYSVDKLLCFCTEWKTCHWWVNNNAVCKVQHVMWPLFL